MILLVKVVAILVVLLIIVGTILRFRKLHRDEMREMSKPLDRRLVSPPPSPYAPSKGFRLLDSDGQPVPRPEVERPRLDPERQYVFGESMPLGDDPVPAHLRHKDDWFLTRSSHRATWWTVARRVLVVIIVAAAVAVLVAYYTKHHPKHPSSTTTTTTIHLRLNTTLPATFTPKSQTGNGVTYDVPRTKYIVSVTGATGPSAVTFEEVANNVVTYQGTVAQGATKSFTMTGNSKITINTPTNATVAIFGRPVTYPSTLQTPLNMYFTSVVTGTSRTN